MLWFAAGVNKALNYTLTIKIVLMKKRLIIVFACMMMLAFTQCGNNNNSNNQEKVTGSKEYRELCSGWSKCMKDIDKAQDCKELKEAVGNYIDEIYSSDVEFDEMCTEEELEEWDVKLEELDKAYEAKAEELGCDKYIRYGR